MPKLLVAVQCLVLCCPLIAEDWPQFRGPGGQGHSASLDLPLTWDQQTHVAWKADIPGNGWSSPVLLNGRVYLTTAVIEDGDNESVSLRALCLESGSGTIVWNVEVARLSGEINIHPKNSHASATPVVTNDRLYVHFASHGTAAMDLQGKVLWSTKIDYQPHHGTGSSPVLFEDLLILNCDGKEAPFVVGLDVSTGDEKWRMARPDIAKMTFSFSTPLIIHVDGRPQLISAASGLVCGYDPRTGKQLWMARYPNRWSVVPRPVYQDGFVLISTGYEGPAELLAIHPDGLGDITDTHIAWRVKRFVPHNPSPIIHAGLVYLVSDRGIASCRNLITGKLVWKERLGGDYSASPILSEDRIYFLSEDGLCTVVRAAPTFEAIAKNDLGERSLASLTPLDGALLIRTIEGLYRIEE